MEVKSKMAICHLLHIVYKIDLQDDQIILQRYNISCRVSQFTARIYTILIINSLST